MSDFNSGFQEENKGKTPGKKTWETPLLIIESTDVTLSGGTHHVKGDDGWYSS